MWIYILLLYLQKGWERNFFHKGQVKSLLKVGNWLCNYCILGINSNLQEGGLNDFSLNETTTIGMTSLRVTASLMDIISGWRIQHKRAKDVGIEFLHAKKKGKARSGDGARGGRGRRPKHLPTLPPCSHIYTGNTSHITSCASFYHHADYSTWDDIRKSYQRGITTS